MSAYAPGDLTSPNYRQHEEIPPGQPKYMATVYQSMNTFIHTQVEARRNEIARNLHEVIQIAQDILREVELQEPRFINTLKSSTDNSGSNSEGKFFHRVRSYSLLESDGSLQLC